jgi:hypothetical protein
MEPAFRRQDSIPNGAAEHNFHKQFFMAAKPKAAGRGFGFWKSVHEGGL